MPHSLFIMNLREALKNYRPLAGGREGTSPSDRIRRQFLAESNAAKQPAAVLILLFPKGDRLHTVFIMRNEYPGHHSGQISFPGGKQDPEDGDLVKTALRESAEEVGIRPEDVEILGSLNSLYIPVSNFDVLPVVGFMNYDPSFTIDRSEVQYLIEVPLEELTRSDKIRFEVHEYNGERYRMPYFEVEGVKIWGATAIILCEFLEVVSAC